MRPQAGPLDEVVYVLEMVVECHAVDTAVLGYVIYGDFGEWFFEQQILQRLLERALCYLRHSVYILLSCLYGYYSMSVERFQVVFGEVNNLRAKQTQLLDIFLLRCS